jgi:hypothetical protein
MALNKLRYNFAPKAENVDAECERQFFIRQTLDRGINESGVLHFRIPPDPDCFTDTTETYMTLQLRVTKADGSHWMALIRSSLFLAPCRPYSEIVLSPSTESALPPNDAYAYVGTLVAYLASSKLTRTEVWDPLSGWDTPMLPIFSPLTLSAQLHFPQASSAYRSLTNCHLLWTDNIGFPHVLCPVCAAWRGHRGGFVPAEDSFALACPTGGSYKIELESASIFVKRIRMSRPTLTSVRSSLAHGGGKLRYNRLATAIQHVPESSLIFRWNDVYNNGLLPHSIYLGFVKQRAYYGDIQSLSTYFETAGLRSLRIYHNGRDVLPIPYTPTYVYKHIPSAEQEHGEELPAPHDGQFKVLDLDKSEALGPFMGLCQALNCISNPRASVALSYEEFLQGCTLYCIQLNSCAGTKVTPGVVDIEVATLLVPPVPDCAFILTHGFQVEFAEPIEDPLICACFGEFDKIISFDSHLNVI